MLTRAVFVFFITLAVSPLMYLGSAFRQANITGYPVFSKANLVAAFPLFGLSFLVIFIGLCVPWGETGKSDPTDRKPSEADRQ